MTRGLVFSFAAALLLLSPKRAHAFEREWHVGGGLGATVYPHYYSTGPALGLNAAYGISDVFDLKLELLGSYHGYTAGSASPDASTPSRLLRRRRLVVQVGRVAVDPVRSRIGRLSVHHWALAGGRSVSS